MQHCDAWRETVSHSCLTTSLSLPVPYIVYRVPLASKTMLHWPGIEPGPPAWQARILPLNHQCSHTLIPLPTLTLERFSLCSFPPQFPSSVVWLGNVSKTPAYSDISLLVVTARVIWYLFDVGVDFHALVLMLCVKSCIFCLLQESFTGWWGSRIFKPLRIIQTSFDKKTKENLNKTESAHLNWWMDTVNWTRTTRSLPAKLPHKRQTQSALNTNHSTP